MATSQEGKKRSTFKSIISGGITGGINVFITFPTEFLKTKMQLYKEFSQKGMRYTIQDTYSKYGILGFYRGLSVLLFFAVPKTAIRFGSNNWFKENVFTNHKNDRMHSFLAGVGGGVTEAITVMTVQDTLKTKLIHDVLKDKPKYKGLFDGMAQIYRAEGFKGVYTGLVPTLLKQSTNQGVRFLVYDDVKKHGSRILNVSASNPVLSFFSGAFAGAVSVLVNTPVDVVKTNMQGLEAKKYKNSMDCFYQILRNEGTRGLYKGTVARLYRVGLDVAITFTLFEQFNRLLDRIL
mmetsp:Transcript_79378/g.92785  ORF Transcript_79378/g.92785 Transcript_79378/m.92785 type:complete len:292 (+) Transcript_79378:31-906(+)